MYKIKKGNKNYEKWNQTCNITEYIDYYWSKGKEHSWSFKKVKKTDLLSWALICKKGN